MTKPNIETMAQDDLIDYCKGIVAERDGLVNGKLLAIAELQRLYNRHHEVYTKETIDELLG